MRGTAPLGRRIHRFISETFEKFRIDFANTRNHLADHLASLSRRIAGCLHAIEPVQDDPGNCVHHGGERRDRQNVSRHFNRAFLGLPLHFLNPFGVRHRAQVPDICKNLASGRL